MDQEDDEDDEDNNNDNTNNFEDSAYFYENRTRITGRHQNPNNNKNKNTVVYLEEENKLPPSYNDIFNLY